MWLTWLSLKWLAICPELDWMHVISCRISTILTIRYLYTAAAVYCSHGMVFSKHLLKRKKKNKNKNLAEGFKQQKGDIHCMKYLKLRLVGFLLVQFLQRESCLKQCFAIWVCNATLHRVAAMFSAGFRGRFLFSFPFFVEGWELYD